jgi:hypothetical protein
MNGNKLGPSMPRKEPFYSRSTFGYIVVGLGTALVSAILFTPLGNLVGKRLLDRFAPEQRPATSNLPPTTTSTPDSSPSGTAIDEQVSKPLVRPVSGRHEQFEALSADPQSTSLSLEYDSLKERFSTVNQSILQRATDLGGLPLKPEIAAALGTVKADLAATDQALRDRKWDTAKQRMERVKKTLNNLESL